MKFTSIFTHENGPSTIITPYEQLKRMTMACMLWEDTFYVDGKSITDKIKEVCQSVDGQKIVDLALECYQKGNLRHIPLFLLIQALPKKVKCIEAIYKICERPDQMTELLSLYWLESKKPIPAQMKRGLAKAFTRFDEYQLAKYNRDGKIKLRDILFLCHAKPKNKDQAQLWKRLINNELQTPNTWETKLSSGEDKKETFQELLQKGKMGRLAIVRNLRNMQQTGVDKQLVAENLMKKSRPILPFQYLAAAKHCPQWEDIIDKAMIDSLQEKEKLSGKTILLIDVSGSMNDRLSSKSEIDRLDAACGIAILAKEICQEVDILTFSELLAQVPTRSGMALRDAIKTSQAHLGTYLGNALTYLDNHQNYHNYRAERIIVITDEQTSDYIPYINLIKNCYICNISPYQQGIQNKGQWHQIDGFSESMIDYIIELEKNDR